MNGEKRLIVNADDFGQSPGINRGIIAGHERGVVTSASLMVHWPWAAQAAAYARTHPQFGAGLHLDLSEWMYRDGEWVCLYEVVKADDADALSREVEMQIATFRRLVGKNPTHIDSHQHAHSRQPAQSIVLEAARRLGVPVRGFDSQVRYCGRFYGQTGQGDPYPEGIRVKNFIAILDDLRPGCTELGCHPAQEADMKGMYRTERMEELKVLCDPRVRDAIRARGIELCSFADLPSLLKA